YLGAYGDFTNLTIPDASFILPLYCAGSFLAMVEMGADGMDPQQSKIMKNVMRGLALVMIPFSTQIPQGVFAYWCTNNTWSVLQTAVLKNKPIKKALGIWEPPKRVAGEQQDLMKMFNASMDKLKGVSEEEVKKKEAMEAVEKTEVFSHKPKAKKSKK
ncbi:hypothetical protein TeGR_g7217, partial [Tetraparma gracilis]